MLMNTDAAAMTRATAKTRLNAFTVDVEDYFQVSALEPQFPRGGWDDVDCRVERSVDRLLELLSERGQRGTFFTLAWVAERFPGMTARIAAEGHELASHGYDHTRLTEMTREAIVEDLAKSKRILEDLGGVEVRGYRAPTFSIRKSNTWVYDLIAGAGYVYSSSIYPIQHDLYGIPDAPRTPHEVRPGLVEVPVTTIRVRNRNYPCAGGGYFRLLPYPAYRRMLEYFLAREDMPAIFYTHPWELDPDQPRPAGVAPKARFRHYLNLDRTESRIARLLGDFRWGRMDEAFELTATGLAA